MTRHAYKTFDELYQSLGIELNGRTPESVTQAEIHDAYRNVLMELQNSKLVGATQEQRAAADVRRSEATVAARILQSPENITDYRHLINGEHISGKAWFDTVSHDIGTHEANRDFTGRKFALLDDFNGKKFIGCDFTKVELPKCDHAHFIDCKLREMHSPFNSFNHATFERVDFSKSDFALFSHFDHATFKDCIFHDTKFDCATFDSAKFIGSIEGLVLPKAMLDKVELTLANVDKLRVVDEASKITEAFPKVEIPKRSFMKTMIQNEEGKLHFGKVGAIAIGAVVTGWALNKLLSKRDTQAKSQAI